MAEIFDPKPIEEKGFEIDERIVKLAEKAEENCSAVFSETDRIARLNGEKVLKAFINNKVHLIRSTPTFLEQRTLLYGTPLFRELMR